MIFREESSRIIHELGSIELYELGQMYSTMQCHSRYEHLPEGLKFCICEICLRPDEDTIRKNQARFQTLIVPHYFARIDRSRGKKGGEPTWQKDHWTAVDATLQSGGKRMRSTENRSWPTDGLRSTANIRITTRQLTLRTRPRGNKDTDTKVLLHWPVLQKIVNVDPSIEEVITNLLLMLS